MEAVLPGPGQGMTTHPVQAYEMDLQRHYFDLVASSRKTTEVRVNSPGRENIEIGSQIRFRCQNDQVLTLVTRIARYGNFDDMFDHEEVASVNPLATRDEQLANIRQIYPPEREALGVLAIGIELVCQPGLR
jgi:ASC-1-like (ASCH) protein